ncbi:MAG TPA: hypothetical protein VFR67_17520, partial [Pilimelia sp.]|nr:hypothetical protein [Pilimelia sp.]
GRVLVVAGLAEDGTGIASYALPSLNRLAATDFGVDAGVSVAVVGVGGDRAVLAGAQGSPPWQETAIWNVRTGGLHRTGGHDWALAFGRDGQVLRRVDRPASGAGAACVDLVTLADTPPEPGPPVCAPALATAEAGGMLSPGGRWVMLRTASPAGGGLGTVLLRTADLRAGHWRPVTPDLPPSGVPRFWDTDDTFVVEKPGNPSEAYRCTTRGCAPLILPADLPGAEIIAKFG